MRLKTCRCGYRHVYGVITSIRAIQGVADAFSISIGLYQRSTLTPYLLAWVINDLTMQI